MSPSSQGENLIFLILLKFKIVLENDTFFFLGKLLLIIHCGLFFFLCEKCQYAVIVGALVIVDPIICDSGTLSPSKKLFDSWHLGKDAVPKSRTDAAGWEGETRHADISHVTLMTQSHKQLSISRSVRNQKTRGAHGRPFSMPVPCLVWCWAFGDPLVIWHAWKS